jgi:transposase
MLVYAKPRSLDEELHFLRAENADLRRQLAEHNAKISERDARIAELEAQIAKLNKMIFGKRSEKMSRPFKEIDKKDGVKTDKDKAKKRRRQRKDLRRQKLREVKIVHEVPAEQRTCPHCHNEELKPVGSGKESCLYEFVPAHLERQVHIQETLSCSCGDYIVTAPGPERPIEGGHYGSRFISHVVVSKCSDSIPLYRLEKQFIRLGINMARSSMCNLFHQAANLLEPIYKHMQILVFTSSIVLADETPIPVLDEEMTKTRKGYIWAFLSDEVAYYRFSATRSGETPVDVLKNSQGTLLVDGYTGYNSVTMPEGRDRAGCFAHVRRKFFDALKTAPIEARHMLNEILELYRVEYEAAKRDVVGRLAHAQLRQQEAQPILTRIKKWLEQQRPLHLPKSPLGEAITYALNQWEPLNHYLTDAKIPIDNNRSEQKMRIIALGRKNYLFAGHNDAAQNLAILQSIIATCEMHGVNPEAYIADALLRIQHHKNKDIADLLPHRWKDLFAPEIPNSLLDSS